MHFAFSTLRRKKSCIMHFKVKYFRKEKNLKGGNLEIRKRVCLYGNKFSLQVCFTCPVLYLAIITIRRYFFNNNTNGFAHGSLSFSFSFSLIFFLFNFKIQSKPYKKRGRGNSCFTTRESNQRSGLDQFGSHDLPVADQWLQ